jgi:hypothetical protein
MDCEVHIPLEGFEVVRVVEQGSPTEREATVLREHYLAGIECDHEHQRDRASCGCSLVDLGWHDSVGEARESWITHVVEVLRG